MKNAIKAGIKLGLFSYAALALGIASYCFAEKTPNESL